MKGYHVHINARSEEDVVPSAIMQKVRDASGAKYASQTGKNPSLSAASQPPVRANPAPQPSYSAPSRPAQAPQSTYTATTTYQAPKPTIPAPQPSKTIPVSSPPVAPASVQHQQQEEPKPLFAEASSVYQPIKTNPKPLGSNIFSQSDSNAQPISQPPRTSISAARAQFEQPVHDTVKSGYQPIKLEPKPLYGPGVATVSPSAPAPRTSTTESWQEKQRRESETLRAQQEQEHARQAELAAQQERERQALQAKQEQDRQAQLAEAKRREEDERLREVVAAQQKLAQTTISAPSTAYKVIYDYDPGVWN